jgi:threonine aldolase
VVEELEHEVADQLGKPAAVFLPTGTMAQQIALRVHADHRPGRRTVLWHPFCHLATNEGDGYKRLHGLHGKAVGESSRLLTLNDLKEGAKEVAEPPAALLLELPQRDLGGQLPAWDELTAQVGWARSVGAAVHMDGARLWGCGDFYDRSLKDISGLFSTVYVSFYKDLGGLPGAALAGPRDVVAEVREWRRPHGGTQAGLLMNAASDLHCLRTRFPRIPAYREQALQIAEALHDVPGVEVMPDPPHTTMMHLLLHREAEPLRDAALRLAREKGDWTFGNFMSTVSPQVQRAELQVGEAALEFSPKEVRDSISYLLRD